MADNPDGQGTTGSPAAETGKESGQAEGQAADLQFTDPNKIPEALQPIYKEMQAGLTRKFQSFSDDRKKLQSELDGFRRKAETLDSLVGMDSFQKWLEQSEDSGSTAEAPKPGPEAGSTNDIMKLIQDQLNQRIAPMEQMYDRQRAATLVDKFYADHPEAKGVFQEHPEILEAVSKLADAGYPLEHAWAIAGKEVDFQRRLKEITEKAKKGGAAAVESGGPGEGGTVSPSAKTPLEAARQAIESVGIDFEKE